MGRISPSKQARRDSAIVKRAVRVAGQNTGVSLENTFWVALGEIAATQGIRRTALISTIESERRGNLSSAIRLFVLDYYRNLCRVKD
jgi:predicted DNA-binding ribbon-helix-helix protein